MKLFSLYYDDINHGSVKKFSYSMPSIFKNGLIEKTGYIYLPPSCPSNTDKIIYFLLGAGSNINKFVCEKNSEESFLFKNFLDNAVAENYLSNDMAVCFLSHCEEGEKEFYTKEEELLMANCFLKHFESYIVSKVEHEVLPSFLPDFHTDRNHRILSGFSFGGAIAMESLSTHLHLFNYYLILSGYYLKKIQNPHADSEELVKESLLMAQKSGYQKELVLIGFTGRNDIAEPEMSYEFELIKRFSTISKENIVFIEDPHGTHDYFTAGHHFLSGLHHILENYNIN